MLREKKRKSFLKQPKYVQTNSAFKVGSDTFFKSSCILVVWKQQEMTLVALAYNWVAFLISDLP